MRIISCYFQNYFLILHQGTMKIPRMWATKTPIGKAILRSRTIRSSTGLFSLPYFYIFLSIVMALLFLNLLLDFVIDEEG
jgi:hypothetical protein